MKVKNVKLEWYVLRWDSNKKQIVDMNRILCEKN